MLAVSCDGLPILGEYSQVLACECDVACSRHRIATQFVTEVLNFYLLNFYIIAIHSEEYIMHITV